MNIHTLITPERNRVSREDIPHYREEKQQFQQDEQHRREDNPHPRERNQKTKT